MSGEPLTRWGNVADKLLEITDLGGALVTQIPPERIGDNQFQEVVNFYTDDQLAPTKQGGRSKANATEVGSSQKPRGGHAHVRQDGTVYIYKVINSKIYYSTNGGSTFTAMQFDNTASDVTLDTSSNNYNYEFASFDNYVYVVAPVYPICTNADAGNHTHATISRGLRLDGAEVRIIYTDTSGAMTAGSDEIESGDTSAGGTGWPRAAKFIVSHVRRLFFYGFTDETGTIVPRSACWTNADAPTTLTAVTGSNIDANSVNESYTGAISYQGFILAFTKGTITRWETNGEKEGWGKVMYEKRNGTSGQRTLKQYIDGWVWSFSWDGEYRTDGYKVERVSDAIRSDLMGLPQQKDVTAQSITKSSQSDWQAGAFPAGGVEAVDVNTTHASGDIYLGVGAPTFDVSANMTQLPSGSDGWTYNGLNEGAEFSVAGGILTYVDNASSGGNYTKAVTVSADGTMLRVKAKYVSGGNASSYMLFGFSNGAGLRLYADRVSLDRAGTALTDYGMTTTDYHTYDIIHTAAGSMYLFVDGVIRTGYSSTFGSTGSQTANISPQAGFAGFTVMVDYANFEGDIDPFTAPANWVSPEIDFTVTPGAWDIFTADYIANSQPVTFEMETTAISGSYTGTYIEVTPGSIPTNTLARYAKVRIRRSTISSSQPPTSSIIISSFTIRHATSTAVQAPCAEVHNGRYCLSYAGVGQTTNDRGLIFGKSGWVKNDQMACSWMGIYNNLLIGFSATQGFMRYELTGTQADGSNFTAYLITKSFYVGGNLEQEAEWSHFFVISRADAPFTFKYSVRQKDGNWTSGVAGAAANSYNSVTIPGTSALSISDKIVVPNTSRPLKGNWIRFRIEVDSADANFYLGGIIGYGSKEAVE